MAENIHISTVLKYNKTYLLVVIIVSDLRQKTIDYIKNRFFVDLPNIFQLFSRKIRNIPNIIFSLSTKINPIKNDP